MVRSPHLVRCWSSYALLDEFTGGRAIIRFRGSRCILSSTDCVNPSTDDISGRLKAFASKLLIGHGRAP
jgi:hypothetical protein